MNSDFFRFVLIPLIIIIVASGARFVRYRLAKPKTESGVQKPGRFDSCLLRIIQAIAIFSGIFAAMGLIAGEMEMGIVFSVLTLIFIGVILLLKREYNLSYQENEDYFILEHKGKTDKVYYKNIVDWLPSYNEIEIWDETQADRKYIKVNIAMIKPEILLRKIAEMTFAGRFAVLTDPNDPKREQELINFYQNNNYAYLIEDYLEERNETSY